MIKAEARKKYLLIRKNIENKNLKDDIIFNVVINLIKLKSFKNIGIYYSLKTEVDTHNIINYLLSNNINVYLPSVNEDYSLSFYKFDSINDLVFNDNFKVYEPNKRKEKMLSNINQLDIIFLPLVAFNSFYYRIGMGKGCYDRTLCNYNNLKIGLAYKEQKIKEVVKFDTFDLKLDAVIND